MHCYYFAFISPCKGCVALFEGCLATTILKLTQVNVVIYFAINLPFKKRLRQGPSLALDAFCQVWLQLDQWFWRKRF